MIKSMLLASLTFFVFTPAISQVLAKDSIVIEPFAGSKVVLVGRSMGNILKGNNFEFLKNTFITDLKAAEADPQFSGLQSDAIYMVAEDGRRRLKLKPEELTFDLKKELSNFSQNWPSFHHTIFDLQRSQEYHIYFSKAEDLDSIHALNFAKLFLDYESGFTELVNYTNITLTKEGEFWTLDKRRDKQKVIIEFRLPGIGVSVINSLIGPTVGFYVDFKFSDRYGRPGIILGLGGSYSTFGEYSDFKFKNMMVMRTVDLSISGSMGGNSSVGFLFGYMKAYYPDHPGVQSDLNKKFRLGFIYKVNAFTVEYFTPIIKLAANSSRHHGFTIRFN